MKNVEEFLKSKELQSELNKAFSQLAADPLKYGTAPDEQQKIEAEAVTKLPAAVGSAYGDHAKAIWERTNTRSASKKTSPRSRRISTARSRRRSAPVSTSSRARSMWWSASRRPPWFITATCSCPRRRRSAGPRTSFSAPRCPSSRCSTTRRPRKSARSDFAA